jgi:hypothetical protein
VRSGTERLLAEQQPDGGWKETRDMEASNAYATGQVLYAFKQAGVSVHSLAFSRGVQYLLRTQVHGTGTDRDGSWPARNTQSARPADFAPTMWAVLGLVGAFGTASVGGLQVLNDVHRERPPARAVEIVLDVSGSMNQRIGARTRWQTALQVLKDVVGRLPDDLRVGLRAYGHRQSSRSPETCSDSELLVPIETLDRDRVLNAVAALTPRGETPLVYSIMLAADDFPPNERGSLIVITDGEESCGGQIESVVERLKSAGTDVSLHIVGFALTSRRVEQQLAAAAENTGGRFYGAQNGDELSRALALASTPSFPYEVFDSAGTRVAARETGPLAEELSPGVYRVVVRALGQELVQQVVVEADKVATLKLLVRGNRLVLEP